MKYSLAELEALPTLAVGQVDDLKIETEDTRVWLSRCTVEDGEPYNNKVSIEKLYLSGYRMKGEKAGTGARWEVVETYQAI